MEKELTTEKPNVMSYDELYDRWKLEDKMKKISDWSDMYSIEEKIKFEK